jgi:hypothetical protein
MKVARALFSRLRRGAFTQPVSCSATVRCGGRRSSTPPASGEMPGSRIATVPRSAIRSFICNGVRPPKISDEEWDMLQDAAPECRHGA